MRYLSNPSSGKMGFALAEAAQRLGAQVTLVAGPVALPTPAGVERIDVVSGKEMLRACEKHFPNCDLFIATAAVGDYAPASALKHKLKKNGDGLRLELKPTPDILKTLAARKRNGQIVVGFAAETQNLLGHAKRKLTEKKLDFIVANDVSRGDRGFASDQNSAVLLDRKGRSHRLELQSKAQLAERVLDLILNRT